MSEIEKMYENCNIKPKQKGYCDCDTFCPYPHNKCNDECPYWKYEDEAKYPPFTAEKQLEIESVIFRHNFGFCELQRHLGTEFNNGKFVKHYFAWNYMAQDNLDDDYIEYNHQNRNIALAGFVNTLWQDLTETEKAEIKRILE